MGKTKVLYFFLFLGLLANSAMAQRIVNLKTTLVGEIIEITYDLLDDKGDQTFDLQFFSSHDSYASPLINITGDVGEEITPGTGKKAIWDAKKELGAYKGEIYIEVRGIVTPPFVRILTPNAGDKFKPGKIMEIQWDTEITGNMNIDLYRNGNRISEVTNSANGGSYTWLLGKTVPKEEGYYLVFTNNNKPGRAVESQQFVVAKGLPIWAVVAGVAVVGGVVGVVISGQDGGEDPDPNTPEDIPNPIKPDGN